ncbi:Transposase, partial [Dysosmobacter welbionis]
MDKGDPQTRPAGAAGGEAPHQIPQQRGLAAAGGRQQQGVLIPPVPKQPGRHRLPDPPLLPGDADSGGGQV